jgi:hypothetical protein
MKIQFGPGGDFYLQNQGNGFGCLPGTLYFSPRSVTAGAALTSVQGAGIVVPFKHRIRSFHVTATGIVPISGGTDPAVDCYRHLPPPADGTLAAALESPAVAGNVDDGAHKYSVVFYNAAGSTTGLATVTVTVADKSVNGKVRLTLPLGPTGTTGRKIYRTAAAGTALLLLDTVADNTTTTYLDNLADSTLGAGIPTANAAAATILSATVKLSEAASDRQLVDTLLAGSLASDLTTDVWPAGTGYTLRALTGASTGAITNLAAFLGYERVPEEAP